MWRVTAVLVVMRNCFERIFYSHNQVRIGCVWGGGGGRGD